MAEHKRSPQGKRLREKPHVGEEGAVTGGRAGGDLARRVATRDEEKRVLEGPASNTWVRKKDQRKE
jgi:hypothetical protein